MSPHPRHPGDGDTAPERSPEALPETLATGLRELRQDLAPARDLWPGIAARLGPHEAPAPGSALPPSLPAAVAPMPRAAAPALRGHDWRRHLRRRNAAYATAAALVLALAAGWQLLPGRPAPSAPPAPADTVATGAAADAGAPLLQAADALAREYQGALREVGATAGAAIAADDLDAELERSATEVRAALARDPDALHLFHRLQRIYAHRLALNLRQA